MCWLSFNYTLEDSYWHYVYTLFYSASALCFCLYQYLDCYRLILHCTVEDFYWHFCWYLLINCFSLIFSIFALSAGMQHPTQFSFVRLPECDLDFVSYCGNFRERKSFILSYRDITLSCFVPVLGDGEVTGVVLRLRSIPSHGLCPLWPFSHLPCWGGTHQGPQR